MVSLAGGVHFRWTAAHAKAPRQVWGSGRERGQGVLWRLVRSPSRPKTKEAEEPARLCDGHVPVHVSWCKWCSAFAFPGGPQGPRKAAP